MDSTNNDQEFDELLAVAGTEMRMHKCEVRIIDFHKLNARLCAAPAPHRIMFFETVIWVCNKHKKMSESDQEGE